MGGGDLAVLAIWVICLVVSLAVSVLTGWRRPGRSGDGAADGPPAVPGVLDAASGAPFADDAAGAGVEAVPGVAANAPQPPAEERRPPAA